MRAEGALTRVVVIVMEEKEMILENNRLSGENTLDGCREKKKGGIKAYI